MATSSNEDSGDKKTMDISKPGKVTPDANARPVIVTHKMIQDPMVKSPESATEVSEDEVTTSKEPMAQTGGRVIKPLSAVDVPENVPEADTADKSPSPDEPSEIPESSDSAVVDAIIDQAAVDKKKTNDISDEEKKKQDELKKLVLSKKYFVPVGQVTKRRKSRNVLFALVGLLMLLVGAYALADAGIIKPGFDVPFDFIRNSKPK